MWVPRGTISLGDLYTSWARGSSTKAATGFRLGHAYQGEEFKLPTRSRYEFGSAHGASTLSK